jgi:hypothetical protein
MKHTSRALAAAALLVITLAGSQAGALCAVMGGYVPMLLTPVTAAMPHSSGALVAGFRADASERALSFEGVRITRRRTSVAFQAIPIAPGLARLVPVSPVRPGTYTLEGLGAPTELVVNRNPMPGAPVRPTMSAVRRVASVEGRESRVELRSTLGFAVPTGIVAVLSYWNDATTPSVWSPAVIGQTELVLYATPGRCSSLPPGFTAPPDAGPLTVRIAYVDQYGQVSPVSDPIPVE